tara:strand:- start:996 stop:1133 length:138 start_codon:yes stop_codon:yes gene_type:complete
MINEKTGLKRPAISPKSSGRNAKRGAWDSDVIVSLLCSNASKFIT